MQTVNDVLLGITSAGLTRYLRRRYSDCGGKNGGTLPDNIRLRASVLVNVRETQGLHVSIYKIKWRI